MLNFGRNFSCDVPTHPIFCEIFSRFVDVGYCYVGHSIDDLVIVFDRPNGSKMIVNVFVGESMTDQSSKDLCDINKIVQRYVKAGVPLPDRDWETH